MSERGDAVDMLARLLVADSMYATHEPINDLSLFDSLPRYAKDHWQKRAARILAHPAVEAALTTPTGEAEGLNVDRLWRALEGFGVIENGTWVSFQHEDAERIAAEYALATRPKPEEAGDE